MRKTAKEYKESYHNIKESKSIEKLSSWKLKNDDDKFNSENYRKNMDSFLDDIAESITYIEKETK